MSRAESIRLRISFVRYAPLKNVCLGCSVGTEDGSDEHDIEDVQDLFIRGVDRREPIHIALQMQGFVRVSAL
jgi:hypothetical protein